MSIHFCACSKKLCFILAICLLLTSMVQTVHVGVSDTSKPRLPHHPDVQIILCNLLQSAEWSHADPHQSKLDPEYANDRILSLEGSHHYDKSCGSVHHEQNNTDSPDMVYYNFVPQSCRLPVLQNSRSLRNNLQNQFRRLSDIRHLRQYRILLRLLPTSNVPVLSEQYKFLHNALFLLHHRELCNLSVSLSGAPFSTVHGNK